MTSEAGLAGKWFRKTKTSKSKISFLGFFIF